MLAFGVRLETHEAVALARELLAHPRGIPAPENILLGFDGSASCITTDRMPTVASVADLLLTLLPPGTANVPAPLRYTIARGLQVVEAPPFNSLGEFSTVLERFEKGERRHVLRGVVQRARATPPITQMIAEAPMPSTADAPLVAPRPTVVPPRPTLVIRRPQPCSREPLQQTVAAPPMFRSFGGEETAGSFVLSSGWWALVAAALIASFAVGFEVMDHIIDRRAATKSAHPVRVSPGISAAAPAANDSAGNPAEVEVRDEIVHVPLPPAVAREVASPTATARANAPRTRRAGTLNMEVSRRRPAVIPADQ